MDEVQSSRGSAIGRVGKAPPWRGQGPGLAAAVVLLLSGLMICVLGLRTSAIPSDSDARADGDNPVYLPIVLARLQGQPTITPTAAPSATATATPTSTSTATTNATWTPTSTSTQTLTPSITPTPSVTNTPTHTRTPSITPTPSHTPTNTPTPTPSPTGDPRLQRFGLNFIIDYGAMIDYPLQSVPFGWYTDYTFERAPQPSPGREYVQMVPVDGRYDSINWNHLREAARNNPGSLWLIGNEPECVYQANLTPDVYVQRYRACYSEIKAADPTAKVAIGGVVQPTPLRLQWLDQVRQRYQSRYGEAIPVDVWNIHNMILMERAGGYGADIPAGIDAEYGMTYSWDQNTNMEYFKAHIVAMRQWMNERGYRNKPLVISEYGVLYPCFYWDSIAPPSCEEVVNTFMDATLQYMLTATDSNIGYPADGNHLVQRWSWFSLNCPNYDQEPGRGFEGNLCDPYSDPKQLTTWGQHYRSTVNGLTGVGGAAREP